MAAQSQYSRQDWEEPLSPRDAEPVQALLRDDTARTYEHYRELLYEGSEGEPRDPERTRLARELARTNLSLNYCTQCYWKIDLHNLLHFLALRTGQHARHEIRVHAEAILEHVIRPWVPLTYEAFRDCQLESHLLSSRALAAVHSLVSGRGVEAESLRRDPGIAPRQRRDLMDVLELNG